MKAFRATLFFCLLGWSVAFSHPWISAVFPSQNAFNIGDSSLISVTFSVDINPATLTNTTIRVHGSLSGLHLSSAISYHVPTRTLTFDSDSSFYLGEIVQVTLTTGIHRTNGSPMPSPFVWNFMIYSATGSGKFMVGDTTEVRKKPWGIASGDWDGDGSPDLVAANWNESLGNTVSVLKNDQASNFSIDSTITVGGGPRAVTAGDFDEDGNMDFAVTNTRDATVSILLNSGNGNFSQHFIVGGINSGVDITAGDYTGNGHLDLAVANSGNITVFLNDGSGNFSLFSVTNTPGSLTSVACGDLDTDGDLDLIATYWGSDSLSIFMNDGTGHFFMNAVLHIGGSSVAAAPGDFDGDGDLDIVATSLENHIAVFINNGGGNFSPPAMIHLNRISLSVNVADYDADGDLDLAVSGGYIQILTNDGYANFTTSPVFGWESYSSGNIVTGDFDDDGDLDLAATYYTKYVTVFNNRNQAPDIVLSVNSLNFGAVKTDSTKIKSFKIINLSTAQDLQFSVSTASHSAFSVTPASGFIPADDSLVIEVLFTPSLTVVYHDTLIISSNDPDTPLLKMPLSGAGYPVYSFTPRQNDLSAAPGDDILVNFSDDFSSWVFNNHTVSVFGTRSGHRFSNNITYNNVTNQLIFDPDYDFFVDEKINVTLTTVQNQGVGDSIPAPAPTLPVPFQWSFMIQPLDGTGMFENSGSVYHFSSTPDRLFARDLNNDGDMDLAAFNLGVLTSLVNDGNGGFTQVATFYVGSYTWPLATGDFDSDGDMDFVVEKSFPYEILIYNNDGNANFSLALSIPWSEEIRSIIPGDFDGDGDLDLATALSHTGKLVILGNDGIGGFNPVIAATVGSGFNTTCVGDFDLDGDLDLAGVGSYSRILSILSNDGKGNFRVVARLNFSSPATRVLSGDFDNDGDLDFIISYEMKNWLSFYENNGIGDFSEKSTIEAQNTIEKFTAGDFNGDGRLDLLIYVNSASPPVQIMLNDSSANFRKISTLPIGYPHSLTTGDFDNDGDLDIAIGFDHDIYLLKNKEPFKELSLSSEVLDFGIIPKDSSKQKYLQIYNRGAGLDLQIANMTVSNPAFVLNPSGGVIPPGDSLTVSVIFAPTAGIQYIDSLLIFSDDPATPVKTVALNGVGYPFSDVFPAQNALHVPRDTNIKLTFTEAVNPNTLDDNTIKVAGAQSGIHPAVQIIYHPGNKTVEIDPAEDFSPGEQVTVTFTDQIKKANGDPMPAPLQWCFTAETYSGTGSFGGLLVTSNPGVGQWPYSIAAGDLDNDGDLDLATSNLSVDNASILINDGSGNFNQAFIPGTEEASYSVAVSDFNGDGLADLAITNWEFNKVNILQNNGNGNFSLTSAVTVFEHPVGITAGDFDRDWDIDLAISSLTSRSVQIIKNNGSGGFGEVTTLFSGIDAWGIANGDLDEDGDLDLAVVNRYFDCVSILFNEGGGNFTEETRLSVPDNPRFVTIGDFDRDSDLDLAVTSYGADSLSVFANNGTGGFDLISSQRINGGPYSLVSADLENDGDLDLAVTSINSDSLLVLTNDGSGHFNPAQINFVGGKPITVVAGDLDNDGDLDLATTNNESNSVTILKNSILSGPLNQKKQIPKKYALYQNYPNPFNPTTVIRYDLPFAGRVDLEIYNILGQRVKTLVSAYQSAGRKSVVWDGKNDAGNLVSSGIYIYRMKTAKFRKCLKLVVLK